jgi:hypothetical protein
VINIWRPRLREGVGLDGRATMPGSRSETATELANTPLAGAIGWRISGGPHAGSHAGRARIGLIVVVPLCSKSRAVTSCYVVAAKHPRIVSVGIGRDVVETPGVGKRGMGG